MVLTIIVLVLPSVRLWRAKRFAPAEGPGMPEGRS
jgi:hypothetical protein